jgi:peptidoglycan/LPS O-acetylase OafA/YrhL
MNTLNDQNKPYYTYLPTLDSLRFLVFIFIVINHADLCRLLNGHSFFFTLTGFLISYISISEINKRKYFNFHRYLARRFLRTLPLFFALVFLVFGIALVAQLLLNKTITTGKLFPFLFLINNFFDQNILFPLANLWALAVTEQYYLLLGILFSLVKRNNYNIGIFFIVIGLIINCFSQFVFDYYPYSYSWYFFINFGIGNILAVFCTRKDKLFFKLAQTSIWLVLLAFLMAVSLLYCGFVFFNGELLPFKELILSLGYAILIFELGFATHASHLFSKFTLLQSLGKRTLGMYVWHAPIMTMISKGSEFINISLSPWTIFVATLIIVIPVSFVSYTYFESYFLKFKNRFR